MTDAGRRAHQIPGHGTALAAARHPLARQQVSAHQPGAGQAERGGPQSEELLAADPGHDEARPEGGKIEAECLIDEVIAPLLVEIAHQRLVIEALDGGGDIVDVADLGLVSTLQKREVVRVRVAIPCRGTVVPHGAVSAPDGDEARTDGGAGGATTATVTEPTTTTGKRIDFTMLDVSAHGMRMLARVELAAGSLIRFRFEELDAPFVIDAIVVRGEESRTGTHYVCRFIGMTVRQTDALFGFVLRTQGDQRRERLRAV